MMPSRREVLLGGMAAAGAGVAVMSGAPAAAALTSGQYIWGLNPNGVVVPNKTWTVMPWPVVFLNTTTVHVDPDGATWIFPAASATGIWATLANIVWDNSRSSTGAVINPPTHRKLARILQQDTGTPQLSKSAATGASTDLTYHSDLAALGDEHLLADGSLGLQQQQVYVQLGVGPSRPDQRVWLEVYQNSGQPLFCRWDGSSAPGTATHPPVSGFQAPSFMVAKICDV